MNFYCRPCVVLNKSKKVKLAGGDTTTIRAKASFSYFIIKPLIYFLHEVFEMLVKYVVVTLFCMDCVGYRNYCWNVCFCTTSFRVLNVASNGSLKF